MTRSGYMLAILASTVMASACTGELESDDNTPPPGSTSGNQNTTFDHDNNQISPWELLDRLNREGPPRYTSHVHSCPKVRYATLGKVLTDLGINVANMTALSSGDLYRNGITALGAPNFANRIRENIAVTTSGASKEFDIFASAGDEIMAAFTNGMMTRCPGAQLFDAANTCRPDGITCLIGQPATSRHLDYCNLAVSSSSSVTIGKRLAIAALLAAAYTCE